jgi:serine/threonine protein kinase/tetratricopeptide (TPR) repeat protein
MWEPQSTETVGLESPPARAGDALAPGSPIGGRYEVRGLLGRGGFATVYRAFDRELRREIALKLLRDDRLSEATLRRFRREAAVARDVASPRLVRIFDIESSGGAVFLTMEPVDGGSLAQRLERSPLPVDEAVRLGIQILEGLRVLHSLKIVHRDVKPGNVLLTSAGEVKLADFGLARNLESDETRATRHDTLLGTFQYLSPEQALGDEVDPRSDLYSFGVVLFEMLTGRLPHEGRSALGTLMGHLREAPPDARAWRPEVPRWLATVVQRLLAKKPADRYPSADAVLAALRTRRAPRIGHRRWKVAAGASALLLLLAGVAPAAWERWRPSRFSHLVAREGPRVEAISRDGEVLWTVPRARLSAFVTARLQPGGPLEVVGVLRPYGDPEETHTLSVLDPENGKLLRSLRLPSGAGHFPGFSDTFRPDVAAADLDGDGGDEILVSYLHEPWWPNYIVLYEPRIGRVREVFIGSGHHRFAAAHDLDGDRRREILIVGINNRMGWYSGIAALRTVPPVNDVSSIGMPLASSPDHSYSGSSERSLVWYSLGPRERYLDLMTVDPVARTLSLRYINERKYVLDFDGFEAGTPSLLGLPRRRQARRTAYFLLRNADRLSSAGYPGDAAGQAHLAWKAAREAGDARLSDWALRVRARALVAAGRFEEGERAFRELSRTSDALSDVAFDAGKAFHLQRELERALSWYRLGLGQEGSDNVGRNRWEHFEGEVLALTELDRSEEALKAVDGFFLAYPHMSEIGEAFRWYVHWRRDSPAAWPGPRIKQGSLDIIRYWLLESHFARGQGPERLLQEIEKELPRNTESVPQLLSLKGELLAKLGRSNEALRAAWEAYELAKRQRHLNTQVLAHFPLIAERTALLARTTRNVSIDREVEDELMRWNEKGSGH